MRRQVYIAFVFTLVTTFFFGIVYPFVVTGVAQAVFRDKANGQLLQQSGVIVGSRIIGQPFSGSSYFHSRPSAAGNGYDASNSGGSNLGPTNKKLLDRIAASVAEEKGTDSRQVPIDLVTASGSGLDPDITPAAAEFQVDRVAGTRHTDPSTLRRLIKEHTQGRQFGLFGEPRVNVLELNRALDDTFGSR
jgi:potassium-transporting ATPase KdpC subunit